MEKETVYEAYFAGKHKYGEFPCTKSPVGDYYICCGKEGFIAEKKAFVEMSLYNLHMWVKNARH